MVYRLRMKRAKGFCGALDTKMKQRRLLYGELRFVIDHHERKTGGTMQKHQLSWSEYADYFAPCNQQKNHAHILTLPNAGERRGRGKKCSGANYLSSANDDPIASEKALLCAVIERAVRDLFDKSSMVREEAIEWFITSDSLPLPPDKAEGVLSFDYICEQLGYDTGWFRAKLMPYLTQRINPETQEFDLVLNILQPQS